MDFAKQQLEKYGWKEGEGLGKKKSGISKPLKAKLKFDNAGLGHKISDELINPWWQRVYDTAAKNVKVKQQADDVYVERIGPTTEITTKRKKKRKKLEDDTRYSNFVKRASLHGNGEMPIIEDIDGSDIEPERKETSGICDLTDEELFKACGGRTAHKGARHGLSMSGKLSRLENHEVKKIGSKKNKNKERL